MKICTKCQKPKKLSAFNKDRSKKGGHHPSCKECLGIYWKSHTIGSGNLTSEQVIARRQYGQRYELRKFYGLTVEDYGRMVVEQNGLCAICKQPERQRTRLSVDHDHKTGVVRGLLCHRCNRTLGGVNDDVSILLAAKEYLEQHQSVCC